MSKTKPAIWLCWPASGFLVLLWLPFLASLGAFGRLGPEPPLPRVLGAKVNFIPRGPAIYQEQVIWRLKQEPLNTENVKAASFLAYDSISGQVLAKKSEQTRLPIASLTKLLTAYVVYENLDLNQAISVPNQPLISTSPALKLKAGDKILALDIFNAMLVGSANDAAEILSLAVENRTKKSFVELMNQTAQALGMADSHFDNPLGFDSPQNYSSAEDLGKLADAVIGLPAFKVLSRNTHYVFRSLLGSAYFINSTNKLISKDSQVYAVKTGFTETAQGSLITQDEIAGRLVVIIIIGSPEREADTLKLKSAIDSGFEMIER